MHNVFAAEDAISNYLHIQKRNENHNINALQAEHFATWWMGFSEQDRLKISTLIVDNSKKMITNLPAFFPIPTFYEVFNQTYCIIINDKCPNWFFILIVNMDRNDNLSNTPLLDKVINAKFTTTTTTTNVPVPPIHSFKTKVNLQSNKDAPQQAKVNNNIKNNANIQALKDILNNPNDVGALTRTLENALAVQEEKEIRTDDDDDDDNDDDDDDDDVQSSPIS